LRQWMRSGTAVDRARIEASQQCRLTTHARSRSEITSPAHLVHYWTRRCAERRGARRNARLNKHEQRSETANVQTTYQLMTTVHFHVFCAAADHARCAFARTTARIIARLKWISTWLVGRCMGKPVGFLHRIGVDCCRGSPLCFRIFATHCHGSPHFVFVFWEKNTLRALSRTSTD
jgi:hypothetical protein